MKKVAIAGTILLDVVKKIDAYPEQGMLVNICEMSRAVGGCVPNTAVDLKTLDPSVQIEAYGKIGRDDYGDYILGFLKERGVDCGGIRRSEEHPTSFSDVFTVLGTGARTFFTMGGASVRFTEDDIDVNSLDCDLFHLGYLLLLDELDSPDPEYGTKAARLLHDVKARGIKTSIDIVSSQSGKFREVVTPSIRFCDYVVINEVEAGALCGLPPRDRDGEVALENLKAMLVKIKDMGVGECVVIHCPELSCSIDGSGEIKVVPSLSLPDGYIAGSVGAGDAFCAGMLYSFIEGMRPEDGMRLASCAAACNLSAADAVSGARDVEKTMELENKFRRKNIKC